MTSTPATPGCRRAAEVGSRRLRPLTRPRGLVIIDTLDPPPVPYAPMPLKIENRSSSPIGGLEQHIAAAAEVVPAEHLRGLSRIVVVDRIDDPRLPKDQAASLPALYFPRVPGSPSAYGEIALGVLLPEASFFKRFLAKSQLRANLVQCTLLVIAQHHLVTISSRKKAGA